WRKISMAWCGRFCHHHVQLSSGKLDYCRFAFLRITMKSGNKRLRPKSLAALVWTTKSETLGILSNLTIKSLFRLGKGFLFIFTNVDGTMKTKRQKLEGLQCQKKLRFWW